MKTTTNTNIHSQEYMESMARLMNQALESPEGMRALAAAIAAPSNRKSTARRSRRSC